MFCSGRVCVLVITVLVAAIANYVYRPLPEILANGEEPWLIRRNLAILQFVGDLVHIY